MNTETKTEEIIVVNATEFKLTENKAKEIESIYAPMVVTLKEMEEQFNKLIVQKVTAETIPQFKRMRLDIAQIRIAADKARIQGKDESKRIGNAIQGAYNTFLYAVKSKEDKLLEKEMHFENIEKERIETLQEYRSEQLDEYGVEVIPEGLGVMSLDVWEAFLVGIKTTYEAKIKAEKEAEDARIETARLDSVENDRKLEIAKYSDFLADDFDPSTLRAMSENEFAKFGHDLFCSKESHDEEQAKIQKQNENLKKEAEAKELKDKEEKQQREDDQKEKDKIYEERSGKLSTLWATMPSNYSTVNYGKLSEEGFNIMLEDATKAKDDQDKINAAKKKESDDLQAKNKELQDAETARIDKEKQEKERILKAGDSEKFDMCKDALELAKITVILKSEKSEILSNEVNELIDGIINHINLNK